MSDQKKMLERYRQHKLHRGNDAEQFEQFAKQRDPFWGQNFTKQQQSFANALIHEAGWPQNKAIKHVNSLSKYELKHEKEKLLAVLELARFRKRQAEVEAEIKNSAAMRSNASKLGWARRKGLVPKPSPKAKEPEMIYLTTIKKEFGLTDKEIMKLGEPDKLVANRHYKSGPPAKLYRLDRVIAFASSIGK